MRIALEPAYILHQRPFRETSLLLDLFTSGHGRMTVVARGVRVAKSRRRGALQPFTRLLVSCQGRGSLMTLSGVEQGGAPCFLQGKALTAGFYFNELLVRFLHPHDPHPELFEAYGAAVNALFGSGLEEKILRLFEKMLLTELGYGLTLCRTAVTHEPLVGDAWYRYYPEQGLIRCEEWESGGNVFAGSSLIALEESRLNDTTVLQDAKRLMRLALAALPGGAVPLQSRRLFVRDVKEC